MGATTAFALMSLTEITDIVLIDVDKEKAEGEAMDMSHGVSFLKNTTINQGDYSDLKDVNFIIITAGVAQKEGQSRLELASVNHNILKDIMTNCLKYNSHAIYILVANPVDVLTYSAKMISGLPRTQIFGTGTNLDSSRFRYMIAKQLNLSPHEVNAYILGEHGDSEFPLTSQINVSGLNINSIKGLPKIDTAKLYQDTVSAASEVIKRKGSTYYAIALSIVDIMNDIMYDQNAIKPLSVCLEGEYGLKDVALSVPTVLGRKGIDRVLEIEMTDKELESLKVSAEKLKEVYKAIK